MRNFARFLMWWIDVSPVVFAATLVIIASVLYVGLNLLFGGAQ